MLRLFASLPLLLAVVAGCSGNSPVAEVSGRVMRNGAAAVAGKVLFLPIGGGKQAIGAIQPDGSFRLGTYDSDDGALVGSHHAVIVKVAFRGAPDDDASFEAAEDQPLTVVANQANEFTFDLSEPHWRPLPQ